MTEVRGLGALWLGLAPIATPLSIWLNVDITLSEIVVCASVLGTGESWITFLRLAGFALAIWQAASLAVYCIHMLIKVFDGEPARARSCETLEAGAHG